MTLNQNLPGLGQRRNVLRIDTLILTAAIVNHDQFVADHEYLNMFFSYIRGGVGGAYDVEVSYSPYLTDALAVGEDAQAWYQDTAYAVGAVAAGAETLSLVQHERFSYTTTGAGQENMFVQARIHRGMERIRLAVIESGNVGAPGDLGIVTYLG